jgi:hypothetical protein
MKYIKICNYCIHSCILGDVLATLTWKSRRTKSNFIIHKAMDCADGTAGKGDLLKILVIVCRVFSTFLHLFNLTAATGPHDQMTCYYTTHVSADQHRSFSRPPPSLHCLAKSSNCAHAHCVVGKWGPFHNDIALSKWFSFTNHPMRMCEFQGFCQATQWRRRPWKISIGLCHGGSWSRSAV